ncbi:MAG: ATP-binding protein [Atopobiaceae bacterium]
MATPSNVNGLPPVLAALTTQPRVRDFLGAAWQEGRLSQAYLFYGAPGSGKLETALAVAKLVECAHGGDGSCDECIRIAHMSHPDVHVLSPKSVTGYLIDQVREIIEDVKLAPVRGRMKVYIIQDAGKMRGASANALLKTIEEPSQSTMFILIARTPDEVLPTIVSRCQQVPFRVISPKTAEALLVEKTGTTAADARVALSLAKTPDRAAQYLASSERIQVRRMVIQALDGLSRDDAWDALQAAKDITQTVSAPFREKKKGKGKDKEQKQADAVRAEYLSARALKQIESDAKRELTARERSGMMEALAAAESVLRDVLLRCEGIDQPGVNADVADVVDRLAAGTDYTGALAALGAIARAQDDLNHNVSSQLTFEVMLLRVKEALTCPPLSR